MNDQEIEVKFFVRDLKRIEAGLLERKARLIQARVFERNLRFDLPEGRLRAKGEALRLRQDTQSRLTFKGASQSVDGVIARPELEFTVGDFESARKFLEALGYQQAAVYEKFRAVYELGGCHIMLDELPYGDFIEIEGPNPSDIRSLAETFGLDMNAAAKDSYLGLYEKLAEIFGLPTGQLTFDALREKSFDLAQVNVRPADQP
jgi:adenylate cyclase class 2